MSQYALPHTNNVYNSVLLHNTVGQMLRSNIDAFGTVQTAEGPPYCRVLITGSDVSQRNLKYKFKIHGVISNVEKVLIHCTRDRPLSEYYCQ